MAFLKYLLLGALLFIGACNNKDDISKIDDPELVSIAFFDALFNENDLEKAASVCTPKLARIIRHYQSTKAVAKHLFNVQFDQVSVAPMETGVKMRKQFKETATINVSLTGTYLDGKVKDVKRLFLKQEDKKWVIHKILKDPF